MISKIKEYLSSISLDEKLVKYISNVYTYIQNASFPLKEFLQTKTAWVLLGIIVMAVLSALGFSHLVSQRDGPAPVEQLPTVEVPKNEEADYRRYEEEYDRCERVLNAYWIDKTNGQVITSDRLEMVRRCQRLMR